MLHSVVCWIFFYFFGERQYPQCEVNAISMNCRGWRQRRRKGNIDQSQGIFHEEHCVESKMYNDELDFFAPVKQMSSDLDSSFPRAARDEVWSTKDRSSACEIENEFSLLEIECWDFLESNLTDRDLYLEYFLVLDYDFGHQSSRDDVTPNGSKLGEIKNESKNQINPGRTATIINDHIRVNMAVVTVFYRNTPCYMAPYYDCIPPYRLRWNTVIYGHKKMFAYHHCRCSLYTFACIHRLRP